MQGVNNNMKLGKNQKLIINQLKNNNRLKINNVNIPNCSDIDTKRLIENLENKGAIEIINGIIKIKNNIEYNFLQKDQRVDFFNICKIQRFFVSNDSARQLSLLDNDLKLEYLAIENTGAYQKFFDWNFNNNKSLNELKKKDLKNWQRFFDSGFEKMNYQISTIQKRIKSWSENKYQLVYKKNFLNNERLLLERKNGAILKLQKDTLKVKDKERIVLEYELTFMTYCLIHELIDIAYSSKKNYDSDFFSSFESF